MVQPEDTLVHLGDVAMDMRNGEETIERFEQLDGDLLVMGNHDVGLTPDDAPFPAVDACILSHGEREFYCTHRPEDIPESWDGWAIHGHHHNNDVETFPFLAGQEQRINVSAELLDYRPISLETITTVLDAAGAQTRLTDVEAAGELVADE